MFIFIFYSITLIFSLIYSSLFSIMKHPLSMGMMLLIQTLLICILSSFQTKTFWFSYILFLIFLGGMLVLFIYVTSLASNEMFNFSMNNLTVIFILFMMMIFFFMFFDKTLILNYFKNTEMNNLKIKENFLLEDSLILNKLYNSPTNIITILLMIYLFLTLIAAVKITNIFEGPLRPNNYN